MSSTLPPRGYTGATAGPEAGGLVSKGNRRQLTITLVVLTVVILLPFLNLGFIGIYPGPFVGTLADAGTYVMLALGLNIVVGYAGLLDLGYAAFFAIGSYTYAMLASPLFNLHYSFWILLLLAPAIAAFFGMVLGAPTLRLRGDYLAIVTLGFGEIVPAFFLNAQSLTGGTNGIAGVDTPILGIPLTTIGFNFGLGGNNPYPYYYLVVFMVLFLILMIGRLRDSRLGRAWMAIREDELAASAMGINTVRTKLLAFAMGAAFSGFAGCIYASKLGFIGPDQFSFSVSVFILSMIILGGIGTIRGVIIGSILLYFLQTYILSGLPGWIQGFGTNTGIAFFRDTDFSGLKFLIYGVALVSMMVLRPEGLLPNRQRKAELHPDTDEVARRESEAELYEVRETDQQASDTIGGE